MGVRKSAPFCFNCFGFSDLDLDRSNNQPKDERRVREIKEYFENEKKLVIKFYDHISDTEYFTHRNRKEYFSGVLSETPAKSLVFLDPDTGMEVKDSDERHVFYSEIKGMYQKMKNSLLVVIQFSKPVDNKEFWTHDLYRRSSELISNAKIDTPPIFVAGNKIALFILTRDLSFKNLTSKAILKYKNQYPELIIGNLLV